MFAYIKGTLEEVFSDYVILDLNGVGYKVFTSLSTLQSLPSIGTEVKVRTYLHVREDLFVLYGFLTKEELHMFEKLITVSGIGPKVALGVLSAISPTQFSLMVIANDAKGLTKAPGIGLKTAQRIILDLKDKINTEEAFIQTEVQPVQGESNTSEAVHALTVLGYTPGDAGAAVKAVALENMAVEEIIKKALKALAR